MNKDELYPIVNKEYNIADDRKINFIESQPNIKFNKEYERLELCQDLSLIGVIFHVETRTNELEIKVKDCKYNIHQYFTSFIRFVLGAFDFNQFFNHRKNFTYHIFAQFMYLF